MRRNTNVSSVGSSYLLTQKSSVERLRQVNLWKKPWRAVIVGSSLEQTKPDNIRGRKEQLHSLQISNTLLQLNVPLSATILIQVLQARSWVTHS